MTTGDADNLKLNVIGFVKEFFENYYQKDATGLDESFARHYDTLLQQHEHEDTTEISRIRRLITEFKPALAVALPPGEDFDKLLTMIIYTFKAVWDGAHRRKKKPPPKDGPIIPGSDHSIEILYYCPICKQQFAIPEDTKNQILDSEDEVELPTHCGAEMQIRISKKEEAPSVMDAAEEEEPFEPVEMLMGYLPVDNAEYLKVLSVGIDIGSSTSHLIFSRLTLKRETSLFNPSNRFYLINREIIYESAIIFTPLFDRYTIDIDAVVEFCKEEYKKAGITPEMIETGAVLVTGEIAKKQNAAEIVNRLSSESGKFVSAAAGPNLESLLSAMGSGIVEQSFKTQKSILHVDIGGGTSNLAIASKGQVLTTSCINVGGRLLGFDNDFKIWRIDGPTQFLMNELRMNYKIGDIIPKDDARTIAREYAEALVEVMRGPAKSPIAKELMMTEDLDFSIPIDAYSFSGGVAEMFYGSDETYDDIGLLLAEEFKKLVKDHNFTIVEPENKIRATVIGAGAFSLSVSGSTTFFDESIEFPLDNIPVIPVNARKEEMSPEKLVEEVKSAFTIFDMVEGEDNVALYFKDPITQYIPSYSPLPIYSQLPIFAKALEQALPNSVSNKKLIILVFAYDMGKMLGIAIRDETSIQSNLLCLDELHLEAGDWIDIGTPLQSTQAFPVTVKSLVFSENKEYSSE